MRAFKRPFETLLLVLAVSLLFPIYSYGYIDPGTGSYVFQVIVAALVAASFAVKIYWQKIRKFVSGLFSKKTDGQ